MSVAIPFPKHDAGPVNPGLLIRGTVGRRKHPLPGPLPRGIRILARQSHPAEPPCHNPPPNRGHAIFRTAARCCCNGSRNFSGKIVTRSFPPLPARTMICVPAQNPNPSRATAAVPKAACRCHKAIASSSDKCPTWLPTVRDLVLGQHRGQSRRTAHPHKIPRHHRQQQHFTVKKQQRIQRLILGGNGHVPLGGQISQERRHPFGAQISADAANPRPVPCEILGNAPPIPNRLFQIGTTDV